MEGFANTTSNFELLKQYVNATVWPEKPIDWLAPQQKYPKSHCGEGKGEGTKENHGAWFEGHGKADVPPSPWGKSACGFL